MAPCSVLTSTTTDVGRKQRSYGEHVGNRGVGRLKEFLKTLKLTVLEV